MGNKYAFQKFDEKKMARATGKSLPISPKQAVEICNFVKNRTVSTAKTMLERVTELKQAVPFKRFKRDVGHKPGIAAGRYPQTAAKEILKLVNSVEANAQNKGLSSDLMIVHMNANRAASQPRSGRVAGESKMAHVEVVVEEIKLTEKKEAPKKEEKKPEEAKK